jgi:ADP-ribose pyrophosphatase
MEQSTTARPFSKSTEEVIVHEGRFLILKKRGHWEYVSRRKASGIVAILAITHENKMLLVEQFRPPVNRRVIELPAGLAGDLEGSETEAFADAAQRELLEETGYLAKRMELLGDGPSSAGLCTEIITLFHAHNLQRVSEGGGDETESIMVHEIELSNLNEWLQRRRDEGCLVDFKIFAAMTMAKQSLFPSRL